jgi:hypothetical protein
MATAQADDPSLLRFVLGSHMSLNSSQGIEVMTPAPSPEMLSAELAPLCSIQVHAVRACLRIS